MLLYVYCMLYDNVTYRKDKRTCFAVGQIQEITFENRRCLGFTSILTIELFVNQTDQTLRPKYRWPNLKTAVSFSAGHQEMITTALC